ncbi:alpha/beta fold hydrolase [Nocardioides currus]|uniref:Alpha/beta hydrolase n=1 Tax=Nocardioides currus TaxID=2133958 RepID=A0A2R7YYK3_9ACTN|nr:alpha/beta fold hydrolase [Nocardioides currus]PUA81394.1 alpha/beta hydrolase [Nocardioides currus]
MKESQGVSGHRPCPPDRSGVVVRDGVEIAYAVHEAGQPDRPTIVLMPTWSLVDSRVWKLQLPYLARHYRVVTFDGRGCGHSGRPAGAAAYTDREYAADTLAVLDATETPRALLVGFSCGVAWSVHVAALHPERVTGIVAIAASCGLSVPDPAREKYAFDARLDTTRGWAKYNQHHWLEGGFDDFVGFFFAQMFHEPHSTKQIEDVTLWASDIAPQTLVDTVAGRLGLSGAEATDLEPLCRQVTCPVVVIHGTEDRVRPARIGHRLAELTQGELVLLDGVGHAPGVREPVRTNHLIKDFADRLHPTPGRSASGSTWVRARRRPKRALYLSSPIGLGHARRDLAIARALRERHPDLEVDWLAQDPVTRVLETAGETVHPASRWLAGESAHIEDECADHDLHAFQAIRRMDEILVHNFMVFDEVVTETPYDLVIGDEAWDVDFFLHENPELKRSAFAWMTDFVGWLPMPSGGPAEAALTADYNAEMIEQRARHRRLRDRSIFVGDPDDVIDESFGPDLPGIREWTADNFDFAGYVSGFVPPDEEERARLRASLGYRPDDLVCVVTVGGSGVGSSLLRRVLDAVPPARRLVPGLEFLVVCGPRIDPASLPRPDGVRVRGFVPDLHRTLAACDLAVVQGGLTTCMELTASRRPFLYVPLQDHFEQNFHVRHRLERYAAGRCVTYPEACDPDLLAGLIASTVRQEVRYRPVETGGAERAADLLAELL